MKIIKYLSRKKLGSRMAIPDLYYYNHVKKNNKGKVFKFLFFIAVLIVVVYLLSLHAGKIFAFYLNCF
jgi:hypothetical protein